MTGFLQTANNAKSTSTGLNNTDAPVTFSVGAGDGAKFPDTADGSFRVTVWSTAYADPGDDTDMEILEVTARTTDSLTATRAKEGTSKVAHSGTVNVALLVTSGLREELVTSFKDAWIPVIGAWTYASASTITVPAGAASIYQKGDKIKWTQTTVKYGTIITVADTLLTIAINTDYVVTNAAISDNYYSHAENPIGFPSSFTYTLTYSGFSADPTGTGKFWIIGNLCFVDIAMSADGTSNDTGFTVSLPVTIVREGWGNTGYVVNNGTPDNTTVIKPRFQSGTSCVIWRGGLAAGWTNTNGKRCNVYGFYTI